MQRASTRLLPAQDSTPFIIRWSVLIAFSSWAIKSQLIPFSASRLVMNQPHQFCIIRFYRSCVHIRNTQIGVFSSSYFIYSASMDMSLCVLIASNKKTALFTSYESHKWSPILALMVFLISALNKCRPKRIIAQATGEKSGKQTNTIKIDICYHMVGRMRLVQAFLE